MVVGNNQASVFLYDDLNRSVIGQVDDFGLGNVVEYGSFITLFQSLDRDDVGIDAGIELGIRVFLERYDVVFDFIDIVVAGNELQ